MTDERAEIADRIDGPDRAGPSQFMREQPLGGALVANMAERELRDHDLPAFGAHRLADGVIVGETLRESFEPADAVKE